jgi:hypothetical protein
MLKVTFSKMFGILVGTLAAGLLLSACMTGGSTDPEALVPAGPDSLTFSIPSSTYSISGETVYRQDSTCFPTEDDSVYCYYYEVSAGKIYSFEFASDSLNIPRVLAGHNYSFDYFTIGTDSDSLPCRLTLDGLLKTTLGTGSTATKIGVPALADSAKVQIGSWRFDQVLYTYLRRSDSLLADKFDTGGVRPRDLPAKYIWGGRKPTYRETIAFATAQLYDQCETYFAGDSVSVPDNIGPCGFEGYPACNHNVPVCSDTGKEYQSYYMLSMSNDAGTVFVNTDLLENSNMSYVGKVKVTCPE